jgi:hypothetical protein
METTRASGFELLGHGPTFCVIYADDQFCATSVAGNAGGFGCLPRDNQGETARQSG